MIRGYTFSDFLKQFPTDEACLEEIKKLRFPKGIPCFTCKDITRHYKVTNRYAYSCEFCRHQVYPLVGTIFEKTTTPLRLWFFAMFLLTITKAQLSVKELQEEVGVTYKTAWRMYKAIKGLMLLHNADLLSETEEVIKWTLFNTFEFKVIQKDGSS